MRYILFLFSFILKNITDFRNFLYSNNYFKSTTFTTYTINIGNLRVGGTGKTPHIEYIIDLLSTIYNICVLSRGYKRKSKGFVWANLKSQIKDLGDESMQIYNKYHDNIALCVSKNRTKAIQIIEREEPATQIVLLDDAFQHRKIRLQLNIILTTYQQPFFKDHIFPAGMLRESRKSGRRAEAIIMTKCPINLSQQEQERLKTAFKPYIRVGTPIFFSTFEYIQPQHLFSNKPAPNHKNIILITGIAQTSPLINYLQNDHFCILKHFKFTDHKNYLYEHIKPIFKFFQFFNRNEVYILTTEKDAVKFQDSKLKPYFKDIPIYQIAIKVKFIDSDFDFFIKEKVRNYSKIILKKEK